MALFAPHTHKQLGHTHFPISHICKYIDMKHNIRAFASKSISPEIRRRHTRVSFNIHVLCPFDGIVPLARFQSMLQNNTHTHMCSCASRLVRVVALRSRQKPELTICIKWIVFFPHISLRFRMCVCVCVC